MRTVQVQEESQAQRDEALAGAREREEQNLKQWQAANLKQLDEYLASREGKLQAARKRPGQIYPGRASYR